MQEQIEKFLKKILRLRFVRLFHDNALQAAHQIGHGFQPHAHAERITSHSSSITGWRKKDTTGIKKRASQWRRGSFGLAPPQGAIAALRGDSGLCVEKREERRSHVFEIFGILTSHMIPDSTAKW